MKTIIRIPSTDAKPAAKSHKCIFNFVDNVFLSNVAYEGVFEAELSIYKSIKQSSFSTAKTIFMQQIFIRQYT